MTTILIVGGAVLVLADVSAMWALRRAHRRIRELRDDRDRLVVALHRNLGDVDA